MDYKFGKLPARPEAIKLRMSTYLDRKAIKLPPRPMGPFGHGHIIRESDWGMCANDKYGCCVFAGSAHETKMLAGLGGKQTWFPDNAVLSDYAAVTGFNEHAPLDAQGNNPTDNGTDMQVAAKFRQNTGIQDGHGNRHKVAAYLAIDPGNLEQHLMALYLFGAVGIGIEVPAYAPDQFDEDIPWDVKPGAEKIVGGHYVPALYWDGSNLEVITWARTQKMTPRFLSRFNDESVAYLSTESLTNRRSPEGFDYDTLLADLNQLRNVG